MSDFIRMVYGYLSAKKIDTREMEPHEAIEKYRQMTKSAYTNKETFINIQLHAKLPDYDKAKIPEKKILEYSLKDENKSLAFQMALGYNKENYQDLIQNIYDNLPNYEAKESEDKGYGKTYSVIMRLKGPNGNTATVTTSWIKDKNTGEMRLTNAYVSKEKKFKGDKK